MGNYLQNNDRVSVCYKESCVHAKGRNANRIAAGATLMLLLIGIAAIVKASN